MPFMKIMSLPKGSQSGIKGPVVSVPSNTVETVKVLPRPQSDDQMIRVKLKRKLCYKGYYEYKFVSKKKVLEALHYLKANNKWYTGIDIDEEWNNDLSEDVEEETLCTDKLFPVEDEDDDEDDDVNEDEDFDSRLSGLQLDSCLQKIDIRQEILDGYFQDIISCAPCEGNSPVSLLNNEPNEGKCFPRLFPSGKGTFSKGNAQFLEQHRRDRILRLA